MLTSVASNECD